MLELVRSSEFDIWLRDLSDHRAKARVLARLNSARLGNLGDWIAVGNGVSEMRGSLWSWVPHIFRAEQYDDLFINWWEQGLSEA
jgi:hypothetical protein